jgi:MFS transporter, DHA2 family, multidrug resistance protein
MKIYPLFGVLAVLLGGSISVLSGQLLTNGLADLRAGELLSIDDAAWIPTAFNMALMFMGILAVYLKTIFGARRVLLIATSVSTVAFLLTLFAHTAHGIIFFLVIAGLGVGTFYPLILSVSLRLLPVPIVLFVFAIYVIDVLVPSYLGPLIQGFFVTYFSYRSIFWIPALVIPFVFLFVYFGLSPSEKDSEAEKVNFSGFFYAACGLALLYAVFDQGRRLDWFEKGTFTGLLLAAIILLTAVIVRHFRMPNPLLRLNFLRDRNFIILAIVLIFFRLSLLTSNLLVPTFLSGVAGYHPLQTGHVLIWGVIPLVVVAPIVLIFFLKIDFRLLLATGFGLAAIACWMYGKINSQWSNVDFFKPMILQAIGQPFVVIPLVATIVATLVMKGAVRKPWEAATVGTFFQTIRLMGGVITTSILRQFMYVQTKFHTVIVTDHFQRGDWRIAERVQSFVQQAAFDSTTPEQLIARTGHSISNFIAQQVITLTVADAFVFVGKGMILILVLIALMRPVRLKDLKASMKS